MLNYWTNFNVNGGTDKATEFHRFKNFQYGEQFVYRHEIGGPDKTGGPPTAAYNRQ